MDAPVAPHTATWPETNSPVARQLGGAALGTLFTLAVLSAVVIGMRRAGGELREPLPAIALAVLAGGLALAALAFRQFVSRRFDADRSTFRYALWAVPTLVLALWTVGVLLPGTSAAGWGVFLAALLVEEGWSWGRVFPQTPRAKSLTPQGLEDATGTALRDLPGEGTSATLDDGYAAASNEVDESATQSLLRRREPDGGETIEGWVRVPFESGQRHANAHLALCPALAATPACYAEPSDGPPCRVKVGQVLPYGVRLEIKLDETAQEPCVVLVEFSIQEQES
jgi:hypothetical protein